VADGNGAVGRKTRSRLAYEAHLDSAHRVVTAYGALYTALKLFHVFLAITAVGANLTYGWWLARAERKPEAAPFILRTLKLIDDRMANPAYGFLLITGAIMVWIGGIGFGKLWVSASIVLWFLTMGLGLFGYTPALKRQIAAVEQHGLDSPQASALALRGNIIAGAIGVMVTGILFCMVFKPG
jgi:uncharacterized membrane protein